MEMATERVAGSHHHHHRKRKSRNKMEVQMDFVPHKDGHMAPLVAYFPTGFDPLKSQQQQQQHNRQQDEDEQAQTLDIQVLSNTEKFKSRQQQLILRPQGKVDFVGTNYSGEGAAWQPCSYALGVFDKESKTLQLVPVAGGKVFRMEPRVAGADYSHLNKGDEANEAKEEVTTETVKAKRKLLLSTFGTQKSRLKMQRYERGLVKEDALGSSKDLHNILHDAGQNTSLMTNEEVLAQANAGVVRNIPPCNILATSPENAYPLDKIITQEDWNSLNVKELMKAARKQDAEAALHKEKVFSDFVLSRLPKLTVQGDTEGNETRARIMLYLHYLLAFFNTPQNVLARASDPWGAPGMLQDANAVDLGRLLGMPPIITAKFLKLFAENGKSTSANTWHWRRSSEHVNLLISYILVLGLKLDNFEMDPYDIAVELKMTISQIRPHFLELGCKIETLKPTDKGPVHVNSSKMKYKATLRAPLQFPKLNQARQKRKR